MLRRFLISLFLWPMVLAADSLPQFMGKDQFGAPCELSSASRLLLSSHDKAGSHLAMEVLGDLWPEERAPVQIVVDVREVPRWVMSWFMLPKLRRYSTPMCLDEQGRLTQSLAPEPGQVLLLQLDNLTVEKRRSFTEANALTQALKQIPRR